MINDWPVELHGEFTVEDTRQYADKTVGVRVRSCLEDADKKRLHWFTEHLKHSVHLVFARTDVSEELDRLRIQAQLKGPAIYGAAKKKRSASQQMRIEIGQYYEHLQEENLMPEGVTPERFYGVFMHLLLKTYMDAVPQAQLLASLERSAA